jgi:hypothetical protein
MHGRLLVAYGNSSNYVKTTAEYLDSLQYSGREVRYVHVTHNAMLDFDINDFDVLFPSYCARMPFVNFESADWFVSPDYQAKLKQFKGLKLLAVQDEYDRIENLRKAIAAFRFDAVFTAVPEEGQQFVYPKAMFPQTEFIRVLTGYVPEVLERRSRNTVPLVERPIAIGYRGRELPAYYGRLGFEKAEIGRRMKTECEARGNAWRGPPQREASASHLFHWPTHLECQSVQVKCGVPNPRSLLSRLNVAAIVFETASISMRWSPDYFAD